AGVAEIFVPDRSTRFRQSLISVDGAAVGVRVRTGTPGFGAVCGIQRRGWLCAHGGRIRVPRRPPLELSPARHGGCGGVAACVCSRDLKLPGCPTNQKEKLALAIR